MENTRPAASGVEDAFAYEIYAKVRASFWGASNRRVFGAGLGISSSSEQLDVETAFEEFVIVWISIGFRCSFIRPPKNGLPRT